jgi:hypothetical protein
LGRFDAETVVEKVSNLLEREAARLRVTEVDEGEGEPLSLKTRDGKKVSQKIARKRTEG